MNCRFTSFIISFMEHVFFMSMSAYGTIASAANFRAFKNCALYWTMAPMLFCWSRTCGTLPSAMDLFTSFKYVFSSNLSCFLDDNVEGGDDLLEVVLNNVGLLLAFTIGEGSFNERRLSRNAPPSEDVRALAAGRTTRLQGVDGAGFADSAPLTWLDPTRPPLVALDG